MANFLKPKQHRAEIAQEMASREEDLAAELGFGAYYSCLLLLLLLLLLFLLLFLLLLNVVGCFC